MTNHTIVTLENGLTNVQGFYCDAVNVGMRPNVAQGDVAFIRSKVPCDIAAVFTSNQFQAAPIKHFQRYRKNFQTDFILINAKNANAMTGEKGIEDIDTILSALQTKISVTNPVMSSTGVIGYRLPVDKIITAFDTLDFHACHSDDTACAIMTTDSFKKELAYRVELADGTHFNIAAICKGAGMINPAMATMLCFIVTDANIPKVDMDILLHKSTEYSFNRISVDGDTSTNDTVMLLANKQSNAYDKAAFSEVLHRLMLELAMMVLKDGEGANKIVTFKVKGAKNNKEARIGAMALSNSLLVKTALFGEDPNWGRIASTIGASGIACNDTTLTIHYDDLLVYSDTCRELDTVREKQAYNIMKQTHFTITCNLGLGDGSYTAYGCDLSYEYVKINAEYRT
ncbi:MAG: bifunctional glutamate N-acetyltransferase/amino-acid acetyltransferase ArgJ [Sulfurovum sp.]|nr:bifunctional glutamate N-acetyltransferase/amino-acid acetyltransferase ArgJ [Sulfurovum sp.]